MTPLPPVKIERALQELDELVEKRDWEGAKAAAIRLKYLQGVEHRAVEKLRDL